MQTFKKEERLSRKKIIEQLFSEGKSFIEHPFKVVWFDYKLATNFPVQVLISVSKRNFKRAVDRNRLKRLIREAYRKNKESFYNYLKQHDQTQVFALIYISAKTATYKEIERKIILIFERLQSEYEKTIE